MPLVRDLVRALDEIAPPIFAESWDNVGLLIGDPEASVSRVLCTIDYTRPVADEGRAIGADFVIAYHPPIFKPLKRVVAGSVVYDAARRGIALYSPHTALDVARGGTNDVLAEIVGIADPVALRVLERRPGLPPTVDEHGRERVGLGRFGELAEPTERVVLFERIKRGLRTSALLVAGPESGLVTKVAVCAGACGEHLADALARSADLYLTGELRHHDALLAAERGLTVVCALHSVSERQTLARVSEALVASFPGLEIVLSERDRDPFTIR